MRDSRGTRLALGLLLVVGLALMAADSAGGDSSPLAPLRGLGTTVFGPVERAAVEIGVPAARAARAVLRAQRLDRRGRELEREIARLRWELRVRELTRTEIRQLDALLRTAGAGGYRIVPARVVALGRGQDYEETVTLDVGRRDGVRANLTVMNGDGLVGRVVTVHDSTATVLLASDRSSSVGGRLEGSEEIGVVSGTGFGRATSLRLELLSGTADLRPGQRVVSFGSPDRRPYVPGVPIGTVARVELTPGGLTRVAVLRPFARFTSLNVVAVVVGAPRTDPRDAVLPPRPTPSPTPSASPGRVSSPAPRRPGPGEPRRREGVRR